MTSKLPCQRQLKLWDMVNSRVTRVRCCGVRDKFHAVEWSCDSTIIDIPLCHRNCATVARPSLPHRNTSSAGEGSGLVHETKGNTWLFAVSASCAQFASDILLIETSNLITQTVHLCLLSWLLVLSISRLTSLSSSFLATFRLCLLSWLLVLSLTSLSSSFSATFVSFPGSLHLQSIFVYLSSNLLASPLLTSYSISVHPFWLTSLSLLSFSQWQTRGHVCHPSRCRSFEHWALCTIRMIGARSSSPQWCHCTYPVWPQVYKLVFHTYTRLSSQVQVWFTKANGKQNYITRGNSMKSETLRSNFKTCYNTHHFEA